ncbi:MAG TPA: hypothetical protein VFN05_15825 [Actinomycetes bacterium]|nr:hypothetical protein [Actinomycetes bacterium]
MAANQTRSCAARRERDLARPSRTAPANPAARQLDRDDELPHLEDPERFNRELDDLTRRRG